MRISNNNKIITAPLVTRLNRLHPYPAMVADELALSLAKRHVPARAHILDPFCGSGRLLAAIKDADLRVGIDTNPLAWLLTKTKLSDIRARNIKMYLEMLDDARLWRSATPIMLASDRKVPWFPPNSLMELTAIIEWINALAIDGPELYLMASILSATTREVSFARQSGWKLHRVNEETRTNFNISAWDCFKRRLKYCVKTLASNSEYCGSGDSHVEIADSKKIQTFSKITKQYGNFDIVITSPPYGDSVSTVQYGAASSLSLEAVGHLNGLQHLACAGKIIDGTCLGGGSAKGKQKFDLKKYWGDSNNSYARSVATFLHDYDLFCEGISDSLKPGGKAIVIVGRRSTGGFRLKLDLFTSDKLEDRGFKLIQREERPLAQKRFPSRINRYARSQSAAERESGQVITMQSEIILVLQKLY